MELKSIRRHVNIQIFFTPERMLSEKPKISLGHPNKSKREKKKKKLEVFGLSYLSTFCKGLFSHELLTLVKILRKTKVKTNVYSE